MRSLLPKKMPRGYKHGLCTSITYMSWQSCKSRCFNPNSARYYLYGAKGVTVCARWKDSFENFLEDMGERPSSDYVLSRKGDTGNYEPSNCEWKTKRENSLECDLKGERNGQAKLNAQIVRLARKLSDRGMTNTEIGRLFGVHRRTIADIINRATWSHVD